MIKLQVEVQDWPLEMGSQTVTIPSNLHATLNPDVEYIIVDTLPRIPDVASIDIWELNDLISSINQSSPGMTADLLAMLMDATGGELSDEEFVRRIKENDFLFEDITDLTKKYDSEESAAKFVAFTLHVPFDADITKEVLSFFEREEVEYYIDWYAIWEQYETMGFKIIDDYLDEGYKTYLIHWREE